MTTNDHRDNIYKAAEGRTEDLRLAVDHVSGSCAACASGDCEWQDDGDAYPDDDLFLEVEVFRSSTDSERTIVCILLGCGGPTTRVKVDQWGEVEFFHSWGKDGDADDAPDLTTIDLYGVNAAPWVEYAERVSEVY